MDLLLDLGFYLLAVLGFGFGIKVLLDGLP
jgi:hypothetical protein